MCFIIPVVKILLIVLNKVKLACQSLSVLQIYDFFQIGISLFTIMSVGFSPLESRELGCLKQCWVVFAQFSVRLESFCPMHLFFDTDSKFTVLRNVDAAFYSIRSISFHLLKEHGEIY